MTQRHADIGVAELEVLNSLWDHGPATVRDVLNQLHRSGRELAYTTVLTFLTRLEQKGFVESDKSDVAYVYRASITRDRVSRSRVKAMLDSFYGGAAAPLILQLIREERFTDDEIVELQQLIDELDLNQKRPPLI